MKPIPAFPLDVLIFGGGIAGLCTLRKLLARGVNAALLESHALGTGQTIASQGVLHGGLKYALNGVLNDASETIGQMPQRWKDCLEGRGEMDLRKVKVLSATQVLWSVGDLASNVTAFFASKTLSSRVRVLERAAYPEALAHPEYRGQVFELQETVVDVSSLLGALAEPVRDRIWKLDGDGTDWVKDSGATTMIFTAGEGNAALLASAGLSHAIPMQTRPLHQVMIRSRKLPSFYSVAIGAGLKPPVVITTHPASDGSNVWYVGGELAESGVSRSQAEQIAFAKTEMARLMPWIDFTDAAWSTLRVNRAEPCQGQGKRPDGPFAKRIGKVIVGWPTKLVMAPLLADMIFELMDASPGKELTAMETSVPSPSIAPNPWDIA